MRRPLLIVGLTLLGISLLAAGCRSGPKDRSAPTEAELQPYDFQGHTALKLRRLCAAALSLKGHRAARLHLLCGRTLLDWYISASVREREPELAALAAHLPTKRTKAGTPPTPRPGRILTAIADHLGRAVEQGHGGSLARIAELGRALVLLQRDASRAWGYPYLVGLRDAAVEGAPFEVQARVIIAAAALDGLRAAGKAPRHRRREILIRGLGFSCPAEAAAADDTQKRPPPTCPLACPALRSTAFRLPPAHRKALIAAKCPLAYLGLSQREHGVYLSTDTLLVARAISYQLKNLSRLNALKRHPLVRSIRGALAQLGRRLGALRVALPLPDMSPTEPNHLQVPLCPSADESLKSAVVLAVDETRLFITPVPVIGVRASRVELFDQLEGYTFPGRPVYVADAPSTIIELARLRGVWKRITRGTIRAPQDRVAIYADAKLSAGRLNDLLDLLVAAGIRHAELVLRNTQGQLRGVLVELSTTRRGEGPPLHHAGPPTPPAALSLSLSSRRLRLKARTGPLAASPLKIPANDLAGLREGLEKTRRIYRNKGGIHVQVKGEVHYLQIARLLHFLRRNSSGRPLYARLVL